MWGMKQILKTIFINYYLITIVLAEVETPGIGIENQKGLNLGILNKVAYFMLPWTEWLKTLIKEIFDYFLQKHIFFKTVILT